MLFSTVVYFQRPEFISSDLRYCINDNVQKRELCIFIVLCSSRIDQVAGHRLQSAEECLISLCSPPSVPSPPHQCSVTMDVRDEEVHPAFTRTFAVHSVPPAAINH